MTATVPPSLHDQPQTAKPSASWGARVLEWFWLAEAANRARQALPLPPERPKQLAARAQSSTEIARRMLGMEVRPEDQAQASANELYRNAVYSALLALSPQAEEDTGAGYSEAVWDRLPEVLRQSNYGKGVSAELSTSLRQGSVRYFAELPVKEQVALGWELSPLVDALLERVELPERGLRAVYVQRIWRSLLLVACLFAVVLGGVWLTQWRPDLAAGKPWRASSKLGDGGCTSPAQECDQNLPLFFHTAEEQNPWLEIDLGAAHAVSKVELQNRADCCADRAAPIEIAVSTDHDHFATVAHRDEEFSTWTAKFAPVQARWVRLRVLKKTYFHLKSVRVF